MSQQILIDPHLDQIDPHLDQIDPHLDVFNKMYTYSKI